MTGSLPLMGFIRSVLPVNAVLQKTRATMPVWASFGCCIVGDCFRSSLGVDRCLGCFVYGFSIDQIDPTVLKDVLCCESFC